MSYLKFDKTLLINLEKSLPKEILRTNRSGAYHCSTILGCNTRKYHGLLVVPLENLDKNNHVLLSSLDETVIQHGAEFNLGLHKYANDYYSPRGHKYLREYICDTIPTSIYRVGGVVLSKEILFKFHENRVLIRYTLKEAHSPTTLRFKPFLAFRSVRMLSVENPVASRYYDKVDNGISTCMYSGYPNLYMQFSKKAEFVYQPDWYRGIEYSKEQERGNAFKEDLYVPGYFEVPIKKGESIVFSAGISEVDSSELLNVFAEELEKKVPRSNFYNTMKNAAQQFYNKKGDKFYLLAGYPWFKCRARDLFIALPGTTLAIDEPSYFEKIMDTAEGVVRSYLNGENVEDEIQEMYAPDAMLWMAWTLQQYAQYTSTKQMIQKYGDIQEEVTRYILDGKHWNLHLEENGLLTVNGHDQAATWMNAVVDGRPVTQRSGYVVEINALWYNTLLFTAEILAKKDPVKAQELQVLAEKTQKSFVETFWNGRYLYDFVEGDFSDIAIRPNQIFAVSLPYSPLDKAQQKSVLDKVTKELYTPKGLRSLTPQNSGYHGRYDSNERERNYAYHNGPVWPWLFGPYLEAYLKIYKNSGLSFVERSMIGMEEEVSHHCVGTISELFDGNPPFQGRGAVSFAMSVAEILRVMQIVKKYNL